VGALRSKGVHRALIALCLSLLCGCSNFGVEVWDNSGRPSEGECPDSDYDNGGSVKPMLGICKMGTGMFVSIDHRF